MKFFAPLLALATAVCAQRINIPVPADGATLFRGQETVVEIDRPNFLSSAQEVAIAIGVVSCASGFCPPTSDTLGTLLFAGGYNPQLDPNNHLKQPHQNFTVTIPANFQTGLAQLGVAHFSLIGASLGPFLETKNVSVVIQ